MQDNDSVDMDIAQDALATLKARADLMGLTYHPSIGIEKLREKVFAAMNDAPEIVGVAPAAEETEGAMRVRKRREANELIRLRVTCMNPAKKEWDGEIFTTGNSLVGSITKYVPFNNDEGWHVPRMIYNMMVDRQCQIFVTARDERGNSSRKGKLIKEFAIEVLSALTAHELGELANRQAMSKTFA